MRLRPLLLAGALVAAGALAGCGGSSTSKSNGVAAKSPQAALTAARSAVASAMTVHIAGSGSNEGSPFSLNLQLVAGQGAQGQIAERGLSFHLIEVGGTIYILGSPSFYRHFGGAAAAQLFQGKWLKAPASTPEFTALGSLTDMRKLLSSLLTTAPGALRSAGTTTIAGQKAVAIEYPHQGGTLYIAAIGTPYPVALKHGGTEAGRLTLTEWDAPVSLKAPTGAIDLTQLHAHS